MVNQQWELGDTLRGSAQAYLCVQKHFHVTVQITSKVISLAFIIARAHAVLQIFINHIVHLLCVVISTICDGSSWTWL